MSRFTDTAHHVDLPRLPTATEGLEAFAHELIGKMTLEDVRLVLNWADGLHGDYWFRPNGPLSLPGVVLVYAITSSTTYGDPGDVLDAGGRPGLLMRLAFALGAK